MSIKNFFVMALASAAMVISLSSCGGGEKSSDSVITTQKFSGGSLTIYSQAFRSLEICPGGKGGAQKLHQSYVDIPAQSTTEDATRYTVTEGIKCLGTMGVRGGTHYDMEFYYYLTDENIGVIQCTCLNPGDIDNTDFLAACGYGVSSSGNSSSGSLGYSRVSIDNLVSLNLRILLNFASQRMTIIGSGSGFVVNYYSADGTLLGQVIWPQEKRSNTVEYSYNTEVRTY